MTTLADIKKCALKIGANVSDEKIGESHTCSVESPKGMVWAASETHEFVDSSYRPWRPDYSDLMDRMSYGVKPCPYGVDCEWCNE